MFYHVLIETKEKVGKNNANRKFFELDKTDLQEIKDDIVIPYFENKDFQFDGYFMKPDDVIRIVIKESENSATELSRIANDRIPPNVIVYISPEDVIQKDNYVNDITKEVFKESEKKIKKNTDKENLKDQVGKIDKTKVFIVHGHDDLAKTELARFIEKLGFEAIILHEQPSSGKTIIEKIEEYSNVGFGLVLYTPCDVGAQKDEAENLNFRARQNVVFEHGFLMGKIGRKNVCALVKDKVETPNDISGVVYITMDYHKRWQVEIAKELKKAGYRVDMNVVV